MKGTLLGITAQGNRAKKLNIQSLVQGAVSHASNRCYKDQQRNGLWGFVFFSFLSAQPVVL